MYFVKCEINGIFLFDTATENKHLNTYLQVFENYCICKLSLGYRNRCRMHLPETWKNVFCCNANETRNKCNAFILTSESHVLPLRNCKCALKFLFANGFVAMEL